MNVDPVQIFMSVIADIISVRSELREEVGLYLAMRSKKTLRGPQMD
jgi:hypothetical protein